MSERKRFHPLALVIYAVNGFKSWFFLLILIVINGGIQSTLTKWGIRTVIVWVAVVSLWKYFSETYHISPQKVILYRGIWRKRETDIPYERIQTIKQRQWFFFKPFGVTQLLIETAGGAGAEAEASMPAVDIQLLELIEQYRQGEQPESDTQDELESVDYRVTNRQIFLFGVTDLSILASLIAIPIFIVEFIPENWVMEAASVAEQIWRAGWILTLVLVVLALIVAALVSLAKTFIQYYNFQVSRNQNTLTVESGLFERSTQKIPLDKIQGLKIRQQPLRKLFSISSVELLLAGGQEKEGESTAARKLYILPIVSDRKLYETLDVLLPEWNFNEPDIQSVSRNRLWYFLRWKLLLILAAVGLVFVNRWLMIVGLIVLVPFLADGWLESRFQGYAIQSGNRVCIQTIETFTKVQTFVERPKVQSFSERTTKWLMPKKLGHAELFLKAGSSVEHVRLKFIDFSDIQELKQFYTGK